MHDFMFDISWDYENHKLVVLVDTGDGDSIKLSKLDLIQMLAELKSADNSE